MREAEDGVSPDANVVRADSPTSVDPDATDGASPSSSLGRLAWFVVEVDRCEGLIHKW